MIDPFALAELRALKASNERAREPHPHLFATIPAQPQANAQRRPWLAPPTDRAGVTRGNTCPPVARAAGIRAKVAQRLGLDANASTTEVLAKLDKVTGNTNRTESAKQDALYSRWTGEAK